MIKISSFYLFSNFLRVTSEFYEDKAIVKMRSLTLERDFEFYYTQVNEISYENQANGRQTMFGFEALGFIGIILIVCFKIIYARPWLILLTQVSYVLAVIIFLTGFIKNRYYYFLDKNSKLLTGIRVTQGNYESIMKVLELVAMKSGNLRETAFDHPFPDSKPSFELIESDIPNYFNKSKTRFYENELIEVGKSIIDESVSYCKYDQLSGQVYRGKQANDSWDSAFWIVLAFTVMISGSYILFNVLPRIAFLSIIAVFVTFLVISFVLRYVKRPIVGLYDKNDRIAYWIWINRSNKEKVEAIIEFVQSKLSLETKN